LRWRSEHIIKPRFVGDDLGKRLHGKKMDGGVKVYYAVLLALVLGVGCY